MVALAAAKFPNLTRAERALLEFAEVGNVSRGQFAIAGTSANPDDSSNDPAHASEWGKDREIRAQLIRWLCEYPQAIQLMGPNGVAVTGARITGDLDLTAVQPPFGLVLMKCAVPGRITLSGAHLRWVILDGSRTGDIAAGSLVSDLIVSLAGVHSSGPLYLDSVKIDGPLYAAGAHFRHGSLAPVLADLASWNLAVRMAYANIRGFIDLTHGFETDGGVEIDNSSIGGDFTMFGSRFINPNNVAFSATSDVIGGYVMLNFVAGKPQPAEFDGSVMFFDDQIAGIFYARDATFSGATQSSHGLRIIDTPIKGGLFLNGIKLLNGATLDLVGSSAHIFTDDERSWPALGKLSVDGFTYDNLGPPNDADTRLRWLALQDGFHPQPYRELAKYLAASGDESGAIKVLIAKEDLRYSSMGTAARLWGGLLKYTIGYGHRPLLAIGWSFAVVLLGWIVVRIARDAGVMRLTWPETTVPPADSHAGLYPLLYSLDVFVPFVNLHQEHYWWPDPQASGEWEFFGTPLRVRGSLVLYYLWFQIIAGWLLSAIFIAGVTGLIRGD